MRIGIDARELTGRPTGVGRYLSGLVREWATAAAGAVHDFVLYAPAEIASPGTVLDNRRFATRLVPGPGGTLWEQVRLPKVAAQDHLDVFFSPAYSAPLRLPIPFVVALHDLSFFAHPEWFRAREGLRRRTMARHAARRAAAIVTISEFSKREIVERLHVADEHVHVLPPGVDDPTAGRVAFRDDQKKSAGRTAEGGTSDARRVLYAGSIFNRRHVPDLVRGVAALARRRPGISLDIVGDDRTFPPEDIDAVIAHQSAGSFVRWHRYASDDELSSFYAQASAFAFLSEYEGLGLTPLEALKAGVPPLLLDTAVARESCGDAALYVVDTHWRAIAEGLDAILFDQRVRDRLLDASPAVLSRYNWARAAEETLEVLIAAGEKLHDRGH